MATINGTFNSFVGGTISGSVGVPGPAGATGPAGPTGATGAPGAPGVGVPAGGASGQFLQKTSSVSYATDWVTVNPFISSASSPLSVNSGVLSIDLSAYLTTAAASSTYAVIAAGLPTGGTVGQVLTKNSGTNFDASFATLIPGDRYLTTSTTSNTLSNTTKTFTIGTGLSYTPTQSITISYDASNHMHGEVLTYNSGTGVLTVDINHHTGSGTYASWVVNVGGVVPATSVTWGSITGTLGNQTDLASALNAKLEVTTAASTYAPLASPSLTGTPLSTTAAADTNTTQIATTAFVVGQASSTAPAATGTAAVGSSLRYARADHVHANPLPTGGTTGQVLSKVDGTNYNTTWTTVSGGAATWGSITGTLSSQTDLNTALGTKANLAGAQFTGKVGMGVAADATAALKVDANGIMFNDSTTQTTAASTFSGGGVNNPVTYSDGFNTYFLGLNSSIPLNGVGVNGNAITPSGFIIAASSGGTITFSDGTTQSTAPTGMSAPTSSNAIWYGSTWYSANVYSIYDSGTMSYINVLGF